MQKKIIALAVAGLMSGAAFAQSNVTVSGLVRMSAEQYKLSNVGSIGVTANASSAENRISDQSSMLVFSGREDLGGGMYASFQIDNRFSPDAASAVGYGLATGNTHLKVGGTWGSVAMGRQDLHYGTSVESYKAYTLQNILGNGIFSQIAGGVPATAAGGAFVAGGANVTIAGGTRTNNVIWYDSPNMSGFTARVAISAGNAAPGNPANEGRGARAGAAVDGGEGKAVNIALNYANGPITAGYSYWNSVPEGKAVALAGTAGGPAAVATVSAADQRGDTLQGSYTFPMGLKVGLGWNKSKLSWTDANASRTAWLIPVSYTFGASQVNFTYAKAGNLSTNLGNSGDSGATAYTLAYGYSLSKRTSLGVAYTKLDNKANASYNLFGLGVSGATAVGSTTTPLGTDVSQMSLNMIHAF